MGIIHELLQLQRTKFIYIYVVISTQINIHSVLFVNIYIYTIRIDLDLSEVVYILLNSAIITLIPKKESPTLLKDYRPISLVHSFSKLAAKVMA